MSTPEKPSQAAVPPDASPMSTANASSPSVPDRLSLPDPRLDHLPPLPVRKITAAIHKGGFDRRQIEHELGLSMQRIYRWETVSGEPSATEAFRFAKYLNVSLRYLVDPDEPVAAEPPEFVD